jgi:hypothetical protein
MSNAPTAGQLAYSDFKRIENIKNGLNDQLDDCERRGMEGEDTNDEFMDLARKKANCSQAEQALLKLNFKPLQKVLDESK